MSVRPIDMQAVVLKAQDHRQVKELTVNKFDNDLSAMAPKIRAESEKLLTQVQDADKKDEAALKKDGDKRFGGDEKGEKREEVFMSDEEKARIDELKLEEHKQIYERLLLNSRRYSGNSKIVESDIHKFDVKI